MVRKTATAGVVGILAGAAIGALAARRFPREADSDHLLMTVNIGVVIACAVIVVRLLRRWMVGYTARTHQDLQEAAESRRRFIDEMTARQASINRTQDMMNARALAVESRMNEVLQALIEERAAHAALRKEHTELTDDYNRVVADSLQQTADLFRGRPAPASGSSGMCIPMPARSRENHAEHLAPPDVADPSVRT
ncbi:hypothetical protein ACFY0G_17265 [Streptomyces sp. NPDC001552]|uniref:hypothetical protein n=1 Tax=Streptomyces sp. NPDC001552 TaxID=3364587 RepID=UPI0036C51674